MNDMTEDILDTWGIEERDEEDMKKAISPHPALQKQFKLLIRSLEADLLGKLAIVGVSIGGVFLLPTAKLDKTTNMACFEIWGSVHVSAK